MWPFVTGFCRGTSIDCCSLHVSWWTLGLVSSKEVGKTSPRVFERIIMGVDRRKKRTLDKGK